MKRIDFFLLLSENLFDYVLILIIVGIVMWWITRKSFDSLINPLCYILVMAVFANTVPVFLYVESAIDTKYFVYFLIAELFFWIMFVRGYTSSELDSKKIVLRIDFTSVTILYYCFSLIFVAIFFIQLKYFNFGIFLSERLSAFKDGGGLGVLSRIAGFITVFNIFYFYYVIDNAKKLSKQVLFISIIMFLFTVTYIFLTGAKSALLQLVFQYYFYCAIYKKHMPSKRVIKILLSIAIVGSLLVFSRYSETGLSGTVIAFINRMVANGDAYWYGYPDEVIETVEPASWFVDLTGPFLYGLRIKDYSESIPGIGTQLMYAIMPDKYGMMIGANSRPPLWGYVMFGYGGLIFSIVWGMLVGLMARKSKTMFSDVGIIGLTLGYTLFMSFLSGITDPKLTFMSLFDAFISLIVISILIVPIYLVRKSYQYN